MTERPATTRITGGAFCAVDASGASQHDGPVAFAVRDGRIEAIESASGRVDDVVLVPGFIDLQVNGVGAVDFANTDPAGWEDAAAAMLAVGTTACCPTFVTAPLDEYRPWLEQLRDAEDAAATQPGRCSTLLGAHLEGPFLGDAPGAHAVDLVRAVGPAELRWLRDLLEDHPHLTRIMTLAPEADPDGAALALLVDHGVTAAVGHSHAPYADGVVAAERGARLATHLFNTMAPLHHREPGLAGAALDDDRLTPTLIADLVHVHPAALRLAISRKRSVALVTDAVAAAAGTAGPVSLEARDGAAYRTDGTLAGSVLTMVQAVRNVVGLGVPLARAVELAATIPSQVLGLTDRGRLAPGARADVVALDRDTLEVRAVWHDGIPV